MEGGSKTQSQGQNSQVMSENIEGFQQCVKEILSLIQQDENFSEMTPEIYNSKKSKLTELVSELSRMYGALAESFSLNSPANNNDSLNAKETKVLLKTISTLEEEVSSLKKKNQDLTDENANLEAEKAKLMVSESNRRIETMGKVIEASRKQVYEADEENLKLKRQFVEEEARNLKLHKEVSLGLVEIGKRDEQITELNSQINLLKISHAAEVDTLKTDMERVKKKLEEWWNVDEVGLESLDPKHNVEEYLR